MAFASLTIDLNARLANIEQDLGRSVQLAERSAQRMQAAFSGIGKAFGLLGAAGAGAGFVTVIKGIIDSADGLNDLATRTGASVKSLASLQLAAKLADTDLQGLGAGLGKLSIYMANNREEAAALGITALDPVDAFAQLADRIAATADPAERNALAMRVLGKSYADLMPMLAQGGESLRRQAAESGPYAERMAALAESSAKFNDTMDELGQTAQTALLPIAQAFTEMASNAIEAAKSVEGFDKLLVGLGQFGTVGKAIALTWAGVSYVFEDVGRQIGGIAAILAALANGDFAGAGVISDAMKDDAEKAKDELVKLERKILDFKVEVAKPIQTGSTGGLTVDDFISPEDARKLQETMRKAFDLKPLDDYISGFKGRIRTIQQDYASLRNDLARASSQDSTPTGLDVSTTLSQARSSFTGGDAAGAKTLLDQAKQQLRDAAAAGAPSFETGWLAKQLEDLAIQIEQASQATAESTRTLMQQNLELMKQELVGMDPIKIPLATDAIADDLKRALDIVRQDLLDNPLQIPATVIADDVANISRAASKLGGR